MAQTAYRDIYHDPFARATLVRVVRHDPKATCRWCGQPAKFAYRWQSDGAYLGDNAIFDGPYCSVGCYRSYNS